MTARETVLKNNPPVEKNVSSFWNDISFTVFILCYKKYPRPHTKKDITRSRIGIFFANNYSKMYFFSIYIVYNSTQKVIEIVIKLTVIKLRSYTINIEYNQ